MGFLMADNTDKIEDLEEIQDAGASATSVDGVSVSFDADAIRRRKLELQRGDPLRKAKRPRMSTLDLRNAF